MSAAAGRPDDGSLLQVGNHVGHRSAAGASSLPTVDEGDETEESPLTEESPVTEDSPADSSSSPPPADETTPLDPDRDTDHEVTPEHDVMGVPDDDDVDEPMAVSINICLLYTSPSPRD